MPRLPNVLAGLLLTATLTTPAAWAQNSAHTLGQGRHSPQPAADRVEQHIAELHAKLHITPDEQALWDKFAQVMRDNAQQMRQRAGDRAAKLGEMNASDNMQSYAQLAALHAQDLQNLSAAFQPLYASLSPEQQRTADTMFRDAAARRAARHQR